MQLVVNNKCAKTLKKYFIKAFTNKLLNKIKDINCEINEDELYQRMINAFDRDTNQNFENI